MKKIVIAKKRHCLMNKYKYDFKETFRKSIEQSLLSHQMASRFEEYYVYVRRQNNEETDR